MPWRAVQEAAWTALNTEPAEDYSLSEESPWWSTVARIALEWKPPNTTSDARMRVLARESRCSFSLLYPWE